MCVSYNVLSFLVKFTANLLSCLKVDIVHEAGVVLPMICSLN